MGLEVGLERTDREKEGWNGEQRVWKWDWREPRGRELGELQTFF